MKDELIKKIKDRTSIVGIIGLGYVGLPLVLRFSEEGFKIIGFDIDKNKVDKLNDGKSYIKHIPEERIRALVSTNKFVATTDYSKLKEVDCIIICVPTPLNDKKEPDLSYIRNTTEEIAKNLRKGHLVSLESTTYPGTTEEILLPRFEKNGLKAGEDFFLVFSPEREDPGNKKYNTRTIPKVVGGVTPECAEVGKTLYEQVIDRVVVVSSSKVAEFTKLLENIFRGVNIALVNEMKILADRMGVDIWEIIEASSTKPFGFMPFYPGPGLGGHCLDGEEMVWVKNSHEAYITTLEELFTMEKNNGKLFIKDGLEFVKPKGLFINSINLNSCFQSWKPVSHIFKRNYRGGIVTIITNDNRTISVTDRHPMIRVTDKGLEVTEANKLTPGDLLPIYLGDKRATKQIDRHLHIDLMHELPEQLVSKVRVKVLNGSWKKHKEEIYDAVKGDGKYDFIRNDVIPLKLLKQLEKDRKIYIDHRNLQLLTGKGPSLTPFPAVVHIDESWARLIGYYLSKGCATNDRGSRRIRITINQDESELLMDIKSILAEKGIQYSTSLSSRWKTMYIRLNSPLLGWLLVERLKCGTNSYTMKIPSEFMISGSNIKQALLMGLFRGDGDVYLNKGVRSYRKRDKKYTHHNNSLTIGYFSINKVLFHQVLYLLHEMGVCPAIKREKQRLLINGYDQISIVAEWLLDDKGIKVKNYLNGAVRKIDKKNQGCIPAVKIKDLRIENRNTTVYSVEVPFNHTFLAAQGVYVHNCIPIDPFYLTWKAREYDFTTRFIELAGEINTSMPYYVVRKIMDALNESGKAIKGSKILVLGVAYKKDVDDNRESPGVKIIDLLKDKGALVDYNDPHIPSFSGMRHYPELSMRSVEIGGGRLKEYDCVVICTDHSAYKDYGYEKIVDESSLVVDTRNATKGIISPKIIKA